VKYQAGEWSGRLVEGDTKFGEVVTSIQFVEIYEAANFFTFPQYTQGTLGMAYRGLAKDGSPKTFVDQLACPYGDRTNVMPEIFSMQLCGRVGGGGTVSGTMVMGGIGSRSKEGTDADSATGLYEGDIYYSATLQETYYTVPVVDMSIEGESLGLPCSTYNPGESGAIVDSGTTYTILPSKAYDALIPKMKEQTRQNLGDRVYEQAFGPAGESWWAGDTSLCLDKLMPPREINLKLPRLGISMGLSAINDDLVDEEKSFQISFEPMDYLRPVVSAGSDHAGYAGWRTDDLIKIGSNYRFLRFVPIQTRAHADGTYHDQECADTPLCGGIQIAEVRFFAEGAISVTPRSVVVVKPSAGAAPTEDDEFGPAMAADGLLETQWKDTSNSAGGGLEFDFGEPVAIVGYSWATGSGAATEDPIHWAIEGSNTGNAGTWVRGSPTDGLPWEWRGDRLPLQTEYEQFRYFPVPEARSEYVGCSTFYNLGIKRASGDEESMILGNSVMEGYHVVFDQLRNRVGWARATGKACLAYLQSKLRVESNVHEITVREGKRWCMCVGPDLHKPLYEPEWVAKTHHDHDAGQYCVDQFKKIYNASRPTADTCAEMSFEAVEPFWVVYVWIALAVAMCCSCSAVAYVFFVPPPAPPQSQMRSTPKAMSGADGAAAGTGTASSGPTPSTLPQGAAKNYTPRAKGSNQEQGDIEAGANRPPIPEYGMPGPPKAAPPPPPPPPAGTRRGAAPEESLKGSDAV
jgi:hypothetical protein